MPRVIHFEIAAENPERVAAFYSGVFGWQIQKWDGPEEYWLVTTGPEGQLGINGGIMRPHSVGQKTINTVDVDDVEAYCAKVEANGGKVVAPKTPIPGVGWFAYAQDPDGVMFGMMQADPSAR